jgi:hypothetical protein
MTTIAGLLVLLGIVVLANPALKRPAPRTAKRHQACRSCPTCRARARKQARRTLNYRRLLGLKARRRRHLL